MSGCQSETGGCPDGRRQPGRPVRPAPPKSIPDLLALSDVMGTGWFAADAAQVAPGMTVGVVGDECHGSSSR